ncbi:MAG: GNAT family N-acetyltransferase [Methanobacterium sp.]|nr:GNAT family N-acetyltransferase [Methanobacterium sp.]
MNTVKTSFRIEPCKPTNSDDFHRLAEAYSKLFNEKNSLKFLSLTGIRFDNPTIYSLLKNAPVNDTDYFTAISPQNEILGIAIFESDILKGFTVMGIVVDSNYQEYGIGTTLINKGIEIAREKEFKAVDISVFADNKSMLIMLLKMDFKPVRIENNARFDAEDLVHLKRYL